MSANVESMFYVGECPWHGLGVHYDTPPKTARECIEAAKLDWNVAATPVKTAIHDKVEGHHVIYREDNNAVLGLVQTDKPKVVQNVEMFNYLESVINKEVDAETAASLGVGEKVFGCFKIRDEFKVADDAIDHYLVIFNDHLKPDGKVTIMNTPIRVVCQNTLSAALSANSAKYRVNVSTDAKMNEVIAQKVIASARKSEQDLSDAADRLLKIKVSKENVERLLDELFPFYKVEDGSSHDRANEAIAETREVFVERMAVDNLANYRGTGYQVFQAATDMTQHMYKDTGKVVDLNYRMNQIIFIDGRITRALAYLKSLKTA
jgi:phage/plasmid-like protein (TIGR03299 family)